LEDYDDERDDIKYYKGRELQRRLAERVKEAELDTRDRQKEKEEIEELKNRIFSGKKREGRPVQTQTLDRRQFGTLETKRKGKRKRNGKTKGTFCNKPLKNWRLSKPNL
jgi:ATPase subunit of ABC transporter with duplicated ATPase domains